MPLYLLICMSSDFFRYNSNLLSFDFFKTSYKELCFQFDDLCNWIRLALYFGVCQVWYLVPNLFHNKWMNIPILFQLKFLGDYFNQNSVLLLIKTVQWYFKMIPIKARVWYKVINIKHVPYKK